MKKKRKKEYVYEKIDIAWENEEITLRISRYRNRYGPRKSYYEGMVTFLIKDKFSDTNITVEGNRKDTFDAAVKSAFRCFRAKMLRLYKCSCCINSNQVLGEIAIEDVIT